MNGAENFFEYCKDHLEKQWEKISRDAEGELDDFLAGNQWELKKDIIDCLTSPTKSYHYVLPTQLLSKLVDPLLDCRSLQASYPNAGAFDARSVAHKVIVPFDSKNYNVLGGSSEPYVNNPLRCPSVTTDNEARQKNKTDWRKLVRILETVEKKDDPGFTDAVFRQVLVEIYRLLSDVRVVYPSPNRISLGKTIYLIKRFIAESSGGDRLEVLAAALFREIADRFKMFDGIKRANVNTADSSSGMAGDIECYLEGQIVLLVEVKDKAINMIQLESKLNTARSGRIQEVLFIAEKGIKKSEEKKIEQRVKSEFTSGQNIYITNLLEFTSNLSILLGEKGRVSFIRRIGPELDMGNSAIVHKKTWANLLREV